MKLKHLPGCNLDRKMLVLCILLARAYIRFDKATANKYYVRIAVMMREFNQM